MKVHVKRAYEPASAQDGQRFLVDRVWPRGVKKKDLEPVTWLKEVAPSRELRQWFGHDPERWDEFSRRYRAELEKHHEALKPLREALVRGPVTLVYSARDEEHNQVVVLRDVLARPGRKVRARKDSL